jgi:hypothetical protein
MLNLGVRCCNELSDPTGALIGAIWIFLISFSLSLSADPYPPEWGSVDESGGPVHFAPVAWPSEPSNAADGSEDVLMFRWRVEHI